MFAAKKRKDKLLSYKGDLTPKEAWALLESNEKAQLIDVRTDAEWTFVGTPDLSKLARKTILLAWQNFPGMGRNSGFEDALEEALDKDAPLAFICRSGARSAAAASAMTARGFNACFNVSSGFEGDGDADGHRGKTNGWKADGLPWRQS